MGCLGFAEPLGLGAGASEDLEGGQAGDEVGEVAGEAGLQGPAALGAGFGGPADEGHEDGDQRQGEGDDQGAGEVAGEDGEADDQRDGHGEDELRQVLGVEPVEGIESLGDEGDEAAGGGASVERTVEAGAHEVKAQLRFDGRGGALGEDVVGPGQDGFGGEDRDQGRDGEGDGVEGPVVEDAGDGAAQIPGLPEGEDGGEAADDDHRGEEPPGGAGALDEPRVDGAAGDPGGTVAALGAAGEAGSGRRGCG